MHPDGGQEESQPGISPRMLKHLIGAGHPEFAGAKQQDSQEFLIHLLSRLQRHGKPTGNVLVALQSEEADREKAAMKDVTGGEQWEGEAMGEGRWEGGGLVEPSGCFRFGVQSRIECLGCGGVKYRVDEQDNFNIPVPDRLKEYLPRNPRSQYSIIFCFLMFLVFLFFGSF